ncbi:MAG: gamma-glutamyl-gamma-aminobutyrate hydrolase family protein [Anaerolineaceae bacterium]|nr:gamma-glutamyl-gamma-aminobutyrate hydrolase family protein [Anaerolineaceae bacterium]
MQAPLIGITTFRSKKEGKAAEHSLSEMYVQAVTRAGGVPVLIPVELTQTEAAVLGVRLDGLLLSGGGDVLPERYGSQPHPKVGSVDTKRDELEISLVQMAARQGWPFLGICRGIQVVNVALGGTLYEDIATQCDNPLRHAYYPDWPRDHRAHAVKAQPDSRLVQIIGSQKFEVNSLHHQGLREVASDLRAVAWAPDGVVEAVELPGHPFGLAVQWHPECIPDSAESRALFAAFVRAAGSK